MSSSSSSVSSGVDHSGYSSSIAIFLSSYRFEICFPLQFSMPFRQGIFTGFDLRGTWWKQYSPFSSENTPGLVFLPWPQGFRMVWECIRACTKGLSGISEAFKSLSFIFPPSSPLQAMPHSKLPRASRLSPLSFRDSFVWCITIIFSELVASLMSLQAFWRPV